MADITTNSPAVAPTMTSLELVDFINADRRQRGAQESALRHDHFMVKVPKVLGEAAPKFLGTAFYVNGTGAQVERPCYRFPKREACLMAMSYSYELQAKVFDRMTELEAAAATPAAGPALPDFTDPAAAAIAWAEQYRARQALQVETAAQAQQIKQDAPKVAVVDYFLSVERGQDTNTVAKELAKVFVIGRTRLMEFLREHQVINASNEPYQRHIDAGRCYMQPSTYKAKGETRTTSSLRITPKGEFYIRELLMKHGCPLRKAPGSAPRLAN